MLKIAKSPNPGVEIRSILGQIFWCTVSCAKIVRLCHLNARDRDGYEWCTFPVGGRNVPKPENIAGREVCKDVVRCAVANEGVEGEQGLEDNLLEGRMRRQRPSWCGVTGHNLCS